MAVIGQIAIRVLYLGLGYMIGRNWEALKNGKEAAKTTKSK